MIKSLVDDQLFLSKKLLVNMKTYRLISLGCKVNAYEVEAVAALLRAEGYQEAARGEAPSLVIINTCAVTKKSEKKSRQVIRKAIRESPQAIIAVMGCLSQIRPEVIKKIPGVDIIVGTSQRSQIPRLVKEHQKDLLPKDRLSQRRATIYEEFGVPTRSAQTRAYLKIQDGCDHFCSYCLIPFARGQSRSRAVAPLVQEAQALVENGHLELVLTGINTGTYGRDLVNINLTKLIKILLQEVPDLARIRISSIEIGEIDEELITLLQQEERLARHLHIPLQSGSASVLKRMKRPYDPKAFADKVALIRQAIPDIALSTDVIVGFPGETKEEFNETYALIKKIGFSRLHVFPFSARSQTVAATLPHQVDETSKKTRVQTLLKLNDELVSTYQQRFIGQTLSAVFEEYDPQGDVYRGHTSNYLEVCVRSAVPLRGKMVNIIYNPVLCILEKVSDNQ
ncbi:MAG: tRNA (N(6)-L-threonylcarbamoyladenosine(37)-C(2))-methylthiotransferase MtaB [Bacilli bacterium]